MQGAGIEAGRHAVEQGGSSDASQEDRSGVVSHGVSDVGSHVVVQESSSGVGGQTGEQGVMQC